MPYSRERALRLVLSSIQPVLDRVREPQDEVRTLEQMVNEGLNMMDEEPRIGMAFDAAVKVVWDTAWHYAQQDHGQTSIEGGGTSS